MTMKWIADGEHSEIIDWLQKGGPCGYGFNGYDVALNDHRSRDVHGLKFAGRTYVDDLSLEQQRQVLKEAIESNGGTVDEVSPFRNVALVGSKKEVSSREVLDALLLDPRILTVYPNCITRAYNGDR